MRRLHIIKLKEEYADVVLNGEKSFEVRENDRGYQKGDAVRFQVINKNGEYIKHPLADKEYLIGYVLSGWGLRDNWVAFSIKSSEEVAK